MRLEVLRLVETQLQRKNLLISPGSCSFNPLWFFGEMERNIYLWRKRLSLAEESRFDFWIDVPALIAKRMQQLAEFDSSNPLLNPHWGDSECSSSAAQPEQNYLAALFDYLWLISKELYQLSLLMEAFEELFDLKPVRPVVVLPSTSRLTGQ